MRITLVYPPVAIPTSAPLGIAALKGFVEKNSNINVKCVDINLSYYENVLDKFINKEFDIGKGEKSRQLVKKAKDIFKKGGKDFYDPKVYNPCANEFFHLVEKVSEINNNSLFEFIYGQNDNVRNSLFRYLEKIGKPDAVGFSILTAEQIPHSIAMAKLIKEELKVPVIFGGGAVRVSPELFLDKFSQYIDYVVKGDGEYALLRLLRGIKEGNLKDINNLIYRKNNKIESNDEIITEKLDFLPAPDYSDFELDNYFCPKKVISVLTSRGCYWRKCAFCSDCDAVSMNYRIRSVRNLMEEIKLLKTKYKTDYFYFADEMIAPSRFKAISEGLIQNNIGLNYYTQAMPIKEFDNELLKTMYKSGCRAIMWGVESGSQRVLDLINKNTNVTDIQNVLRQSNSAGIKNAVYAFGGFPTETEEEYKQTLQFLQRNMAYIDVQFTGLFRLTKNSEIYKNPAKFSITNIIENKSVNPFVPIYSYETKEGITQQKSVELYDENLSFFLGLNKFSPFLGKFRDHMLIVFND